MNGEAEQDVEEAVIKSTSKPAWFTPLRLLAIFMVVNMVVYLDRGVIASNGVNGSPRSVSDPKGSGIQGEFGLSNFQDGLLATAFLVGLLLASPIFSEACKHYSAFRLMGIGMGTWVLAAAGCGLSFGFVPLLLCRMLVGVGEASFVALASPFIDDYAPPAQKASWFAAFYLCIPVGFAAGYIYGGLVAAAAGWRAAFLIEAGVMVPFVLFMFTTQPLHLHGMHDAGPDPTRPRSIKQMVQELGADVARVARHGVWLNMVAGYTLYTAVLGVYAFWGPKAGARLYHMQGERADIVFGAVTVATGIAGSISGGVLLDKLGSSLRNANLLCGMSALVGCAFALTAFLATSSFAAFMAVFALGELALFHIQAPVGAIGMWSVPPALRPLAISMTTMSIHIGGDVPSPPFLGWLETVLEAGKPQQEADLQWRYSMSIITLLLLASGAVFLNGARLSLSAADYRTMQQLPDANAEAADSSRHGTTVGSGTAGSTPRRRRGGSAGGEADKTPLLEDGYHSSMDSAAEDGASTPQPHAAVLTHM